MVTCLVKNKVRDFTPESSLIFIIQQVSDRNILTFYNMF